MPDYFAQNKIEDLGATIDSNYSIAKIPLQQIYGITRKYWLCLCH